MSQLVEVKVPDIGDFKEVEVIEVLVAEGDTITEEQSLITGESGRAPRQIPSSAAGVIRSLKVKVGDKVAEGLVLIELEPAAPQAEDPAQADDAPPADKADADEPAKPVPQE